MSALNPKPFTMVTIGGGNMIPWNSRAIDEEIARLTGRRRPRVLFIPTASSDDEGYIKTVEHTYGKKLGGHVDSLLLLRERPNKATIAAKIATAHIIYVGGGNTLKMMRLWRRLGVDAMLEAAGRRGAVMAGLSAGALCWYDFGHSDSMSFYHPEDWDYIRVRGLGFIPATGCPHYDGEKRDENFRCMIARHGGPGLAMDDGCAIVYRGDRYKVIRSIPGANAYRVIRRRGEAVQTMLAADGMWRPVKDLLARR